MILKDAKQLPKEIKIPKGIAEKVNILSNCEITEDEVTLFNAAIKAILEYVSNNNIDLSDYFKLNIFFTYSGELTFLADDDKQCGSQFHLAIYRMEKLRRLKSHRLMLFVFIEELAHYFLRIYDETVMKYKVEEIMKYISPDFTLDELKGFGLNGL